LSQGREESAPKMARREGLLAQFLQASSIHGLRYLREAKGTHRLLWSLFVTFQCLAACSLIWQTFNDWRRSPTVTSMENAPVSEVPFPAVTVCAQADTKWRTVAAIAEEADVDDEVTQ